MTRSEPTARDIRLLRVGSAGSERPVVETADGRRLDLRPLCDDIDGRFLADGGIDRARGALDELPEISVEEERIGPPVAGTRALICIGLNYADHAAETGAALPEQPVVFSKGTNTIVGPHDDVIVPPGSTTTDYEVELAVVLGAAAYRLPGPDAALGAIAGYAISNDVSERELQLERGGGQWYLGKSCPTFNPLGPWLVPADQVVDPQSLDLVLRVNGELRPRSTTAQMVFSVAHLVWYLSQHLALEPGDVVNTGTPAGVALGLPGTPYLREGDVVEATIEGLGTQRQHVRSHRSEAGR